MDLNKFGLVIHGGGGALITREHYPPEKEASLRKALSESLAVGHSILQQGGTSLDAVIASVKVLEDSPLFNAGRGSIFTREGQIEMEATIMDGKTLKAGAVTGIKTIKNPIDAAYLVMTKTEHVMLMGEGAEKLAKQHGLRTEEPSYFWTEARWQMHQKGLEKLKLKSDDDKQNNNENQTQGTVGAVALDKHGNIAVATSTGGKNNKMFGRVGDSAIIGSGTYADNRTCAISCTGTAEYYMRLSGAHDISSMINYAGKSLKEATDIFVLEKLKNLGGDGGVIGIDAKGNMAMPYIEGMLRGYVREDGVPKTFIFSDEKAEEFE